MITVEKGRRRRGRWGTWIDVRMAPLVQGAIGKVYCHALDSGPPVQTPDLPFGFRQGSLDTQVRMGVREYRTLRCDQRDCIRVVDTKK